MYGFNISGGFIGWMAAYLLFGVLGYSKGLRPMFTAPAYPVRVMALALAGMWVAAGVAFAGQHLALAGLFLAGVVTWAGCVALLIAMVALRPRDSSAWKK